jgi:uncharacterized protein (DUF1810 family)
MPDPYALQRFVDAQASTYRQALAELRRGRKTSHWMWFIFPQLKALGRSSTALHYGIASLDEARAYLAHPSLGPRLNECTKAILSHRSEPAETILGHVDAMKLRSSMTLFEAAANGQGLFGAVLDAFYGSERDDLTLSLLQR